MKIPNFFKWPFTAMVVFLIGGQALAQSLFDTSPKLHFEISIDGRADFYTEIRGIRSVHWSVRCKGPMYDCVAHSYGLELRVDNNGVWITAKITSNARISLQQRNFTLDQPDLFSKPLTQDAINRLSQRQNFIVIEEQGHVALRQPTSGLNQVVSYLHWLNIEPNDKTRDARQWTGRTEAPIEQNLDARHLDRFLYSQHKNVAKQYQLIPSDKPQSEFAIRSQGGSSFFSKSGQAGY